MPDAPDAVRALAGGVIFRTLWSVGKSVSDTPRTPTEIEAYADAIAAMFCAYLKTLRAG